MTGQETCRRTAEDRFRTVSDFEEMSSFGRLTIFTHRCPVGASSITNKIVAIIMTDHKIAALFQDGILFKAFTFLYTRGLENTILYSPTSQGDGANQAKRL
jgi:hypothetical protein